MHLSLIFTDVPTFTQALVKFYMYIVGKCLLMSSFVDNPNIFSLLA